MSEDLCKWLNSQLREYRYKVRISKRFGQHLLADCRLGYLFTDLVRGLGAKRVLEVGTGLGFLTMFLCRAVESVVTVEIDFNLASIARRNLRNIPNVMIVAGDGLNIVKRSVVRADVVASNTPFNISSQILVSLVKSHYNAAILTLQKEVAYKLIASPGSREYSRFSAFVNTFMDVELVATFSSRSFYPRPEVDAAVIKVRRKVAWSPHYEQYESFLKCIFSEKRKLAYKVVSRCTSGKLPGDVIDYLRVEGRRVFSLTPSELLNIFRESLLG